MREGFAVGDVVWLKSGGPQMTVVAVLHNGFLQCWWFTSDNMGPEEAEFPADALTPNNISWVDVAEPPEKLHEFRFSTAEEVKIRGNQIKNVVLGNGVIETDLDRMTQTMLTCGEKAAWPPVLAEPEPIAVNDPNNPDRKRR